MAPMDAGHGPDGGFADTASEAPREAVYDNGGGAAPVPESGDEVCLGRVVSVSGAEVVVLLENPTPGAELPSLQIGVMVKMHTPASTVFGVVSSLSIPIPAQETGGREMKIVELELLGEAPRQAGSSQLELFQRGVSMYPALGDQVYATTPDDLSHVYSRPDKSLVRVGSIHQDASLPAHVVTDDLLGKHFAVLGTTGSGKSCAMALILRRTFERHPNAHILLLDPHNEYASAFGDCAEVLDPQSLQLPYWLFNFDEFCEVVVGGSGQGRNAETAILSETIPAAKRAFLGKGEDGKFVTIDTPVPYRMAELIQLIDETMGKLDHPEELGPYLRLKTRLNNLRADSRFAFMFSGISVRDNMADILSKIFRIPVDGKPITIVDLSGIPSEILNVVVSVLCRMTFDLALYADRAMPMMLVCEEAHRYVPQNPDLGFEPTKRALARIAKEGRKYGVSLCVVSQRPSELAAEILSQCNTTFALRLTNQKDQDYVRSIMSESALGLLDFLPSLRNAEAIAVGEGVSVPVRIAFDELPEDQRPRSGTVSHSTAWGADDAGDNLPNLKLVIERWRRQTR